MVFICDNCQDEAAVVHCFADNASLCRACDAKTHTASKAAQRHERVALTPHKEQTQCDICQEQPAVMFCAEDRALICRRCDLMIHTANEFTKTHHRYILSGFAAGLRALPEASAAGSSSFAETGTPRHGMAGATGMPAIPGSKSFPRNSSAGDLLDMPKLPMGAAMMSAEPQRLQLDSVARGASDSGGSGGAGPSGSGGAAGNGGAGSSTAERASSVTLAAELLGMPSLPQNYSAKDVDAAWGDAGLGDLDDWSNFLEVPDLGFLPDGGAGESSTDWLGGFGSMPSIGDGQNNVGDPVVSVRDASLVASAVPSVAPQPLAKAAAPAAEVRRSEPLVPEVPLLKRPRVG